MNIHKIFAVTLGALPAGCTLWCPPNPYEVDVEADLVPIDLRDAELADDEDALCQLVCEAAVYRLGEGLTLTEEVQSCALALNESAEPYLSGELEPVPDTGLPEEVVGRIECEILAESAVVCTGRRPLGHRELGGRDPSPLREELRRAAVLEEASIRAFCQLALFLRQQGASALLLRRCLSAALDEVDHARATRSLVHALGGSCPRPTVESVGAPSLFAVARHNAVEGCVRETWSALEAHLAANNAAGPSLQRFFARIARDETRHAQLARDLHDWFMTRLRRDEQAEVCRELRAALRSLPEQATRRAAQRPRSLGGPDIALARVAAQRLAEELSP